MNRRFPIYLLLILSIISFMPCDAQNKVKDMRKKAGNLEKQIAEKESILMSSRKDVKSKMQNLELLNAKIKEHQGFISLLDEEVRLLDDSIASLDKEVNSNEKLVDISKKEYAEALRRARKYGSLQDKLLFVVSAEDFNTMLRRYRYTRDYMNAHRDMAKRLNAHIVSLEEKRARLDTIRTDKNRSLELQNRERENLEELEKDQKALVKELQRESKKVEKELKKQRQQLAKLNAEIERIIEREIEAQRARERAAAEARAKREREAAAGKKVAGTSAAERENEGVKKMSGSFLQNKGKLPVPVTGPYHLVSSFGTHKGVEGKGNVAINNGGIVIQGKKGAKARCVFDGTVTAVFRTTDYALVIVRHGKYLSVYGQLGNIQVKDGSDIKAGTIIGDIAEDAAGHTRLLFQLRNEKQKLNPAHWIKL